MDVYSQLKKAQLEHVVNDPATLGLGFVFFNTTTKEALIDNGTEVGEILTTKNIASKLNDYGIKAKPDTRVNLEALAREAGKLYIVTDDDNTFVYDSGTELLNAGGFDRIDTLANLQVLPRKQGKLYYAIDEKDAFIDNGTELVQVGASKLTIQKTLTNTLSTNGIVAELGTNLLEIGKKYKVSVTMSCSRIGTIQNEIQELSFSSVPNEGSYNLDLDGEVTGKIWYDSTALEVETALVALPSVDASGVTVSGDSTSGYTIEFVGTEGGLNQTLIIVLNSTLKSGGTGGVNEVQRIQFSDVPTSGTFTLTFNGETTAPIAYNATGAVVKNALELLTGIDEVTVTAV